MLSIFLGAGFSVSGRVPLASQLFDQEPEVDRISRQRLVERVLNRWTDWHAREKGTPEQYLAVLESQGGSAWKDATWYVALVIALRMGRVELVGMNPTIVRHNLNRTSGIPTQEEFWTSIFKRRSDVTVLTTNYDILAERGLRTQERPRVPRPGFHYGDGTEQLEGGGYPAYTHIQKIRAEGKVPLLKLHGSISWAVRESRLVRYHDCRPAIRGDAAIIAPVTEKTVPGVLRPIWDKAASALAGSNVWMIVGYSLPEYDEAINRLLTDNARHKPHIHVFNPDDSVANRVRKLFPSSSVISHPGLPNAIAEVPDILA